MAETDLVVERARQALEQRGRFVDEDVAQAMASWITKHAPIVEAAKAHEAAKWSTPHRKVCRICKAVSSERTP